MIQDVDTNVHKTVTAAASMERAFQVFVEQVPSWWPPHFRITESGTQLGADAGDGGRWYEIGPDGTEYSFCRVLAYEPPSRLALGWHIDGYGEWDPDPEHASEVEVRFVAEGADRTRVELEHRNFEAHGYTADRVRAGVDSAWSTSLGRYVEAVAAG